MPSPGVEEEASYREVLWERHHQVKVTHRRRKKCHPPSKKSPSEVFPIGCSEQEPTEGVEQSAGRTKGKRVEYLHREDRSRDRRKDRLGDGWKEKLRDLQGKKKDLLAVNDQLVKDKVIRDKKYGNLCNQHQAQIAQGQQNREAVKGEQKKKMLREYRKIVMDKELVINQKETEINDLQRKVEQIEKDKENLCNQPRNNRQTLESDSQIFNETTDTEPTKNCCKHFEEQLRFPENALNNKRSLYSANNEYNFHDFSFKDLKQVSQRRSQKFNTKQNGRMNHQHAQQIDAETDKSSDESSTHPRPTSSYQPTTGSQEPAGNVQKVNNSQDSQIEQFEFCNTQMNDKTKYIIHSDHLKLLKDDHDRLLRDKDALEVMLAQQKQCHERVLGQNVREMRQMRRQLAEQDDLVQELQGRMNDAQKQRESTTSNEEKTEMGENNTKISQSKYNFQPFKQDAELKNKDLQTENCRLELENKDLQTENCRLKYVLNILKEQKCNIKRDSQSDNLAPNSKMQNSRGNDQSVDGNQREFPYYIGPVVDGQNKQLGIVQDKFNILQQHHDALVQKCQDLEQWKTDNELKNVFDGGKKSKTRQSIEKHADHTILLDKCTQTNDWGTFSGSSLNLQKTMNSHCESSEDSRHTRVGDDRASKGNFQAQVKNLLFCLNEAINILREENVAIQNASDFRLPTRGENTEAEAVQLSHSGNSAEVPCEGLYLLTLLHATLKLKNNRVSTARRSIANLQQERDEIEMKFDQQNKDLADCKAQLHRVTKACDGWRKKEDDLRQEWEVCSQRNHESADQFILEINQLRVAIAEKQEQLKRLQMLQDESERRCKSQQENNEALEAQQQHNSADTVSLRRAIVQLENDRRVNLQQMKMTQELKQRDDIVGQELKDQLQGQLSESNAKLRELQKKCDRLENENEDMLNSQNQLYRKMSDQKKEINNLTHEKERLEEDVTEFKNLLDAQNESEQKFAVLKQLQQQNIQLLQDHRDNQEQLKTALDQSKQQFIVQEKISGQLHEERLQNQKLIEINKKLADELQDKANDTAKAMVQTQNLLQENEKLQVHLQNIENLPIEDDQTAKEKSPQEKQFIELLGSASQKDIEISQLRSQVDYLQDSNVRLQESKGNLSETVDDLISKSEEMREEYHRKVKIENTLYNEKLEVIQRQSQASISKNQLQDELSQNMLQQMTLKLEQIVDELARAKAAKEEVDNNLRDLRSKHSLEVAGYQQGNEQLKEDRDNLSKERDVLKRELERVMDECRQRDEEQLQIRDQINLELAKTKSQLTELGEKCEKLQEATEKLKDIEDLLFVLRIKVDEDQKKLNEIKKQNDGICDEKKQLSVLVQDMMKQQQASEGNHQITVEELQNKLKEKEHELQGCQLSVQQLLQEKQELQKMVDETYTMNELLLEKDALKGAKAEVELKQQSFMDECQNLSNENSDLRNRCLQLEEQRSKELQLAEFARQEISRLQHRLEAAGKEAELILNENANLKQDLQESQAMKNDLERQGLEAAEQTQRLMRKFNEQTRQHQIVLNTQDQIKSLIHQYEEQLLLKCGEIEELKNTVTSLKLQMDNAFDKEQLEDETDVLKTYKTEDEGYQRSFEVNLKKQQNNYEKLNEHCTNQEQQLKKLQENIQIFVEKMQDDYHVILLNTIHDEPQIRAAFSFLNDIIGPDQEQSFQNNRRNMKKYFIEVFQKTEHLIEENRELIMSINLANQNIESKEQQLHDADLRAETAEKENVGIKQELKELEDEKKIHETEVDQQNKMQTVQLEQLTRDYKVMMNNEGKLKQLIHQYEEQLLLKCDELKMIRETKEIADKESQKQAEQYEEKLLLGRQQFELLRDKFDVMQQKNHDENQSLREACNRRQNELHEKDHQIRELQLQQQDLTGQIQQMQLMVTQRREESETMTNQNQEDIQKCERLEKQLNAVLRDHEKAVQESQKYQNRIEDLEKQLEMSLQPKRELEKDLRNTSELKEPPVKSKQIQVCMDQTILENVQEENMKLLNAYENLDDELGKQIYNNNQLQESQSRLSAENQKLMDEIADQNKQLSELQGQMYGDNITFQNEIDTLLKALKQKEEDCASLNNNYEVLRANYLQKTKELHNCEQLLEKQRQELQLALAQDIVQQQRQQQTVPGDEYATYLIQMLEMMGNKYDELRQKYDRLKEIHSICKKDDDGVITRKNMKNKKQLEEIQHHLELAELKQEQLYQENCYLRKRFQQMPLQSSPRVTRSNSQDFMEQETGISSALSQVGVEFVNDKLFHRNISGACPGSCHDLVGHIHELGESSLCKDPLCPHPPTRHDSCEHCQDSEHCCSFDPSLIGSCFLDVCCAAQDNKLFSRGHHRSMDEMIPRSAGKEQNWSQRSPQNSSRTSSSSTPAAQMAFSVVPILSSGALQLSSSQPGNFQRQLSSSVAKSTEILDFQQVLRNPSHRVED